MEELANGELSESMRLLIWFGGSVITGLLIAIGVLWKSRESNEKYIREQDKANLKLLSDIANNYKSIGADVSNIEDLLLNSANPGINEVRQLVQQLVKKVDKQWK